MVAVGRVGVGVAVGVGVEVGVGALPALDPHVVHYDDEDNDHGTGTEGNPVEDFHVHSPDLGPVAITIIHGWRGGNRGPFAHNRQGAAEGVSLPRLVKPGCSLLGQDLGHLATFI